MTNGVRRGDCRVIEKQAVLDALEKERKVLLQREQIGAEHILVHHAIRVVEELPDKLDVVRCKDCELFEMPRFGEIGFCKYLGIIRKTMFFCADGKKKKKDGDEEVIEFIKPEEQEHGEKEHTYCGKTWDQMNVVLDIVCEVEDRIEMTDEERDAFDIAIQCITTVMNRMKDDSPIEWD